jgi:exopolysaccharide biosynthesis WecB/TagA/CpsF family protein
MSVANRSRPLSISRTEPPRAEFLNVRFDLISRDEALALVLSWPASRDFGYVVTPNVDHVVRLQDAPEPIAAAYRDATLSLCDSRVLAKLGHTAGLSLPVTPGSDFTRAILDQIDAGARICVIGGTPEQLDALRNAYPGLDIVQHCPPMGLRDNLSARQEAVAFAAASGARFIFIAVGSPQQEMLAHETLVSGTCSGFGFCIGASIDFITGRQRRAPQWMQGAGFEWLHRLASEPGRFCAAISSMTSRFFRSSCGGCAIASVARPAARELPYAPSAHSRRLLSRNPSTRWAATALRRRHRIVRGAQRGGQGSA